MPKLNPSQVQFLTTLYEKVKDGALAWTLKGAESHETVLGEYRIHVDKREMGDDVTYIIWIFDKKLDLLDRITDDDAKDTLLEIDGEANGRDVIRDLYSRVSEATSDRLSDVVAKLKSV